MTVQNSIAEAILDSSAAEPTFTAIRRRCRDSITSCIWIVPVLRQTKQLYCLETM